MESVVEAAMILGALVIAILGLSLAVCLYRAHCKRLEAMLEEHRRQIFHPTPFCQFETDVKEIGSETKTDPEE